MTWWRLVLAWDARAQDMVLEDDVGDTHHYNFEAMTYWLEGTHSMVSSEHPSRIQRRGPGDWYFMHPEREFSGWHNDFIDMTADDIEDLYQRWLRGET